MSALPVHADQNDTRRVVVFYKQDRRGACAWIGNLLWLVLGGWHLFLSWCTVGVILCCTCIFCPCGLQVIKISIFLLFPFGKSMVPDSTAENCCCCNCFLNIIWALTVGWVLALQAVLTGIVLCLTIVGIPFGIQCFKLAMISFWPFGMDFAAEETVATTAQYYGSLP